MGEKRGDYHGGGVAPAGARRSASPGAAGGEGAARSARSARAGAARRAAPVPWPALALAGAFALALALRLVPLVTAPGAEMVADSAFHLRMVEEVVARGRVPGLDPMCEAPEGRAIAALLPTGLYHAAAGLHRALAPLDRREPRFHALLFVALAGALVVVPAFFAARAVFTRPEAAAIAALLAAVLPAHLHRTHAYWLRYDALGTLLALVHVALLLDALAAPGRVRALRSAALAALALLSAVACWRVALVLPFVELAFALPWAAWRGATREVREPFTLVVGLSAALFPLVPWLSGQSFPLSGAWLAAVAATAALWLPWMKPGAGRWPARGLALGLAAGAGWAASRLFAQPDPYAAAAALVPAKIALALGIRPALAPIVDLGLGIEELTSLSPLGLFGPGVLSWLGPWFVAAPLFFARAARGARLRPRTTLPAGDNPPRTSAPGPASGDSAPLPPAAALFAVLCVAMTLLTLLFERNKVLLAPLAAVALGGFALRLVERARGGSARAPAPAAATKPPGATRTPPPGRARHVTLARAALALLAACAAVTLWHAASLALSRRPALRPGLAESLAFLRDSTAAEAVVMSPWEHGYEVQTLARRASVMDGLIESAANQRRILAFAAAAMSRGPDSLAALCRRHGAEWLLVPPSTQLHSVAVAARAPFTPKLIPGIPLTPAEADRVLIQMMVLGREYPEFVKVFESEGYRVYRVAPALPS